MATKPQPKSQPKNKPTKTKPAPRPGETKAALPPINLKSLQSHPLADIVPGTMTEEEQQAMREDMKERGMRVAIVLYQGKILDGRERYKAATACGADIKHEEFIGTEEDARAFVMSMNLQRRTLSGIQKAMAVADLYVRAVNAGGAKPSQNDLCSRYGVSKGTLSLCIKAQESRNAGLITRIRRGEVIRSELEEMFYDKQPVRTEAPADSAAPDNVVQFPGSRHPERQTRETEASKVASAFKALGDDDRYSFVELAWPQLSKVVGLFVAEQKKPQNKKRKTG